MGVLPTHIPLPATDTFPWSTSTESFWRTELHPLDSYRSTPELPTATDIVIIGAGMSGVSTAYHIINSCQTKSMSPPSIIIIEARQLCSGATGRNGGHLKLALIRISSVYRQYGTEAAAELGNFYIDQIHAMKEVVDREGLDCDFLQTRSFDVWMDEEQAREQGREVETLREAGIEVVKKHVDVLKKQDIEAVTGVKGAAGARSVPAASLWPYKFVTGLMAKIVDQVNLQTHTVVRSVSEDKDAKGFYTISTSRGTLTARKVVFASNAYTAGILPSFENVITPVKGTASRVKRKHSEPTVSIQQRVYTYNIWKDPDHVDYLNHRLDATTIIGGAKAMFEDDPKTWLATVDDSILIREPSARSYFEGRMGTYYQDWDRSGASIDRIWTGIMGSTPDGFPLIGKVPERQGQYLIAGFNGAGMLFNFKSSQDLVRMVVEEAPFQTSGMPRIFELTSERLRSFSELAD